MKARLTLSIVITALFFLAIPVTTYASSGAHADYDFQLTIAPLADTYTHGPQFLVSETGNANGWEIYTSGTNGVSGNGYANADLPYGSAVYDVFSDEFFTFSVAQTTSYAIDWAMTASANITDAGQYAYSGVWVDLYLNGQTLTSFGGWATSDNGMTDAYQGLSSFAFELGPGSHELEVIVNGWAHATVPEANASILLMIGLAGTCLFMVFMRRRAGNMQ
jgi:hypothetical protein